MFNFKVTEKSGKADYYSYEEILEEKNDKKRLEFLQQLKTQYDKDEVKLSCECNKSEEIKMKISNPTKPFISTFPHDKHKHTPYCNFFGDNYTPMYEANWIESENEIEVKFKNTNFILNKKKNLLKKKGSTANKASIIRDTITLNAFIIRLMTESWNGLNFYRHEKQYSFPTLNDFFESIKLKSKKIKIRKSLKLSDVLYTQGKLGRSYYIERDHSTCMFLLLPYDSSNEKNPSEQYIKLRTFSNEVITLSCTKTRWEIAKDYNKVNLQDPCWVGGWVRNAGTNEPPEFVDITVVPTNSLGVWSESKYEQEFYDLLCKEKRFFTKPYSTKYYPEWEGMKPDALLLDTSPQTIIEIFGMSSSDIDYHERRKKKISHFNNLTNYSFWHWDAHLNTSIPPLPK